MLRVILVGIIVSILCVVLWPHQHQQPAPVLHERHITFDDPTLDGLANCTLAHRDSYSCGASNPCSNGACCGASGFCGYGPTYCGTGCLSQCDATAECRQYAKTPGKIYGCQSNCVLSPKPGGGKATGSVLENKVIGYYEAWMARNSCHKIKPTDLPLDALTHVNFAFASIDPDAYQIVAMDSSNPTSLFKDTTNIKSVKEDISVFVSIGGWSFSDNGTETQPLFGEIAADEAKRKKFAHNVVNFMQQYGFDGVDLDWEYPGAGDRGGKPEDTENYVLLVKTLRETFDKSGSKFGLTFTAPASYWYLRWFDLPGMVKHVDWINVMTYDLHGVWDAQDPIGSIVQGHTNLTEIKTALELFWRVDIPPAKLVLGLGFYGRSFTLADPECTKPGCPFSGACMLAYYEIMSVLQGYSSKKRANNVGLGGAMIWASDLDDDKYSAHTGLLGRNILSTSTLQDINKAVSDPKSVITDLAAFNGQRCFRYMSSCVNPNDGAAMAKACGSGYTVVGWDDAGCGKKSCHCGKPICCPSNAAPKGCNWRGQDKGGGIGSDCSGQCNPGEINVNTISSSWDGSFTNDGDTDKCGRGSKVFCCPDPDYQEATSGCAYADCGKDCPSGKAAVLTKYDKCYFKGQKYCCPNPAELTGCHWEGGSGGRDCANAKCNATELQVALSTLGDSSSTCDWGRERAACCTVKKPPVRKAMCTKASCEETGACEDNYDILKRDLGFAETQELAVRDLLRRALEKRGNKEVIRFLFPEGWAMIYLFTGPKKDSLLRKAFRTRKEYCGGSTLSVTDLPDSPTMLQLLGLESEHVWDKKLQERFWRSQQSGVLSSGALSRYGRLPRRFLEVDYNTAYPELAKMGPVGKSKGKSPSKPNERFGESFGSTSNPLPLLAVEKAINIAKENLFFKQQPVDQEKIWDRSKRAVETDADADVDSFLSQLQLASSVFEYIRDNRYGILLNFAYQTASEELGNIESAVNWESLYLQGRWEEWNEDHFASILQYGRRWARAIIQGARAPWVEVHNNGRHLANYERVMAALEDFEDLIAQIQLPKVFHMKIPNPDNGEGPSGYNS
ncbi:hypothetical protein BDV06DRAFT_217331 [Aspergillus oleicola]